MKHFYAKIAAGLIVTTFASAQERAETPRVEVGLNYSLLHSGSSDSQQLTSNGGSAYIAYNWNRVLGLVADFGAYHNGAVRGGVANETTFTYLFGPRFNWRKSRINPYVQFLVGGARLSADPAPSGSLKWSDQNGFATALGGGVDIALMHHVSFTPIQVEYLMTQIPNLVTGSNRFENGLRYSAGVVLRFGEK